VRVTGLIGESRADAATRFNEWFPFICPRGVALVQGELACVQGSSLWFSSFGLRSLLEHGFVSDVSSRCLYLRGPRLVFFR
jgi:hypothetical protein